MSFITASFGRVRRRRSGSEHRGRLEGDRDISLAERFHVPLSGFAHRRLDGVGIVDRRGLWRLGCHWSARIAWYPRSKEARMQQRPFASAAPRSVRPPGPVDYATPLAWWGWSWEPPVPMSVSELVAAGDL